MVSGTVNIILVAFVILNQQSSIESQMIDSRCGPLNYKNAQVTINETTKIATIICNQNYVNKGSHNMRCINRKWQSTKKPICIHNDCLSSISSKNIANGRFDIYIQDEYILDYRCDKNYERIGQNIITCTKGNWSSHSPVCRHKENQTNIIDPNCLNNSLYYNIENGKVLSKTVGKYGNVHLEYSCNRNYKLIGPRRTNCIDGIWMDNVPPTCKINDKEEKKYSTTTESNLMCKPFEYKNAQVTINETGRTATVNCNQNYTLLRNSKFYCSKGIWEQTNYPICVPNTCSLGFTLENGKLLHSTLNDDNSVSLTYTCDEKYKLLGMNTTVCKNGKLLNNPPECKEIETEISLDPIEFQSGDCKLFDYKNAKVTINHQGDIATVTCNSNYILFGYSFFECINGIWEQKDYPKCVHRDCFSMENRSINNGIIFRTTFGTFGEINVTYNCNVNYNLRGSRMTSCFNGKWSSDPPVCDIQEDH